MEKDIVKNKVKSQLSHWKRMFGDHTVNKTDILLGTNKVLKAERQKTKILIEKWEKDTKRQFTKKKKKKKIF